MYRKIFIILLLLVSIIHIYAYRVWFFSSQVLTHGDWIPSLPEGSLELFSLPMMWKSYLLGSMDLTPPFYPFLFLEGSLAYLGITYAYIQRITFMWPIALLTLPCCFLLIRSITKNSLSALVGATVYAYNTYFLIIQTGHLTLMTGFALSPLVLYWFIKSLEEKSYFYAVLTGLLSYVISFYEFRSFYLLAIVAGLYFLYHLIFLTKKEKVREMKQTLILAVIPLFIVGVLNFYWMLPIFIASKLEVTQVLGRSLFGKEFYNINKSIALFHPFWTGGEYFPFIMQKVPIYFFIYPIAAFIGFYLNRFNKKIVFFTIISLLGIFLTKQNNPPFESIYEWLYAYFPGFSAFREASKFYFYTSLGYSMLIGALIAYFFQRSSPNNKWFFAGYGLSVALLGISLFNLRPLVTGEIGTLFEERTIPRDYIVLNNHITNDSKFFRTLWVPVDSRWGINTNVHPKLSTVNMMNTSWKKYFSENNNETIGERITSIFDEPVANNLFDISGIKYVIVPLVDIQNDDNFFVFYDENKKFYERELDKSKYLTKLNINTTEVRVYENKDVMEKLSLSDKKLSLEEKNLFRPVRFTRINTTEYQIELKNVKNPTYLNFSENYHPDWKIQVGNSQIMKSIFIKQSQLPTIDHFRNVANLNSFYIDPEYIKNNVNKDDYKMNSDGSIDITLTLFFKPQVFAYMGFLVSIISFIGIITIAGFLFLKKNKNAKTTQ